MVEKRATRKWSDPRIAERTAFRKFGATIYAPDEMLSPAQFEQKIPGNKVKDFVKEYSSSISTGLTLANVSDKRVAVNPAVSDFDDVMTTKTVKPKGSKNGNKNRR